MSETKEVNEMMPAGDTGQHSDVQEGSEVDVAFQDGLLYVDGLFKH